MTSSLYIPIIGMVVLAAGFIIVSIALGVRIGPARYNRAKYDAYECGIEPTPQPIGGGRFPVKYYITAMLFIIESLLCAQKSSLTELYLLKCIQLFLLKRSLSQEKALAIG